MSTFPLPDGTANSEMTLYPAGVVSYNQDYQNTENIREKEDLIRTISIAKTLGIVAKHAEINSRLFPSTVTGNQINITSGTGFTDNGTKITVLTDEAVNDVRLLTGYSLPSSTNSVYLVLRKHAEDYSKHVRRSTGIMENTRRAMNYTIECISVSNQPDTPLFTSDRDVVVLGRLTSVAPAVFDITEKTGGRKILRTTETTTMETGIPNIMENNIDFVNEWEALNFPEWGSDFWKLNGAPNNRDFTRLFARVNNQVAVLRGIKFQ